MLRRTPHILLLLLALGLAACDNADDLRRPDAEVIVGSWTATDAGVRTVIPGVTVSVFDALRAGDQILIEFTTDGAFAFAFDVDDDEETTLTIGGVDVPVTDVNLSGTYTVDEGAERLQLTIASVSGPAAIEYDLNGENELELIVEDPELVAVLFGIADAEVLATVATGAELTFGRSD